MKASFYDRYGPPEILKVKEIEKPIPGDSEVLVKIHAATVNRTDCATVRAKPFFMRLVTGLLKPRINVTGTDFAGTVEETGRDVMGFSKGDRVFGFNDTGVASHTEYLVISGTGGIEHMPDSISFSEAAASCEGAHYAINFINKVDLREGDKVLVYGASGAIGSAAVQLLKNRNADITAVCGTENIERIRSLGIENVIDYEKEDFTKVSTRYRFIFDTVGKSSFFICRHLMEPDGAYISSELGHFGQNVFLALVTPLFRKRTVRFPYPDNIKATLEIMKSLLETGRFKPLIDREYTLDQISEAFRYAESGTKTGNVILSIDDN